MVTATYGYSASGTAPRGTVRYTQAWFGGQVLKIVSTAAALATSKFNRLAPRVNRDSGSHFDPEESLD